EKLTLEWFSAGVGDDDPVLRGGGVELGCGVGLWCGKEGDPKEYKRHYSDNKEHCDECRPLEFCEGHGGSWGFRFAFIPVAKFYRNMVILFYLTSFFVHV